MGWGETDVQSLDGKVVLVTGGNGGLGFENCRALHKAGATVIMAARSKERCESAVEAIVKTNVDCSADKIKYALVDLADLDSIKSFAIKMKEEHTKLEILINNAGVMALPQGTTKQGFETQMGINHLGHYALTLELMPLLLKSDAARIVQVSSLMHKQASKLQLEAITKNDSYSKWDIYAQSKLANLLFVSELARRLAAADITNVTAVASHPGYSNTDLQSKVGGFQGWLMRYVANPLFAQSSVKGALPTLYAAVTPDLAPDTYVGPSSIGELYGAPQPNAVKSLLAQDQALAEALWNKSQELTGVFATLNN
eukprot:m.57188 g.57188  ORF g.57188 m.57188 type:complete len:312 (+) comp13711_c0_seq1:191-1126(+)